MLSKEEVQHIAKLVRLGLTQVETKKYQQELSSILGYVNLLKEVDVSKVEPTNYAIQSAKYGLGVMREDEGGKLSPKLANELIKSAPDRKGRYVRVKAVL